MSRPPLRGFNHNIGYKKRSYHVQTEDSGIENPHVFTHLYLGGMIIASAKTDYSDLVSDPDHKPRVVKMMQEQHKSLMKRLRRGEFNDKIIALVGSLEPEGEEAEAVEALAPEGAAEAEVEAAVAEAEAAAAAEAEAAAAAAAEAEAAAAAAADEFPEPEEDVLAPEQGFGSVSAYELAEAATAVDTRRYPEMAGVARAFAKPAEPLPAPDPIAQEPTVKDFPPTMEEGEDIADDLLPEAFDAAARMERQTERPVPTTRIAPPHDPLYDTAPLPGELTERSEVTQRVSLPLPAAPRKAPVRFKEPTVEPRSVHTPESLPMIHDVPPPRRPTRAPASPGKAQRPDAVRQPRPPSAPVFASLLGDTEEQVVDLPPDHDAPRHRPAPRVGEGSGIARPEPARPVQRSDRGAPQPRRPDRPGPDDSALVVDRPPPEWADDAGTFAARRGQAARAAAPGQTSSRAPQRPAKPGVRIRSEVFDAPLPKDSQLLSPAEMLDAVPARKRPAGVYPLPSQMPARPPHPDPTLRQPPRQAASTPQRYTAPRRARSTASRPVHVTGSYRVPSGAFPITEVQSSHRGSGATRPAKPPQQQSPQGGVVARPAVVIGGGSPPPDSGVGQPQSRYPRPPAEPPRRQQRPAATPQAARRSQPSTRGMPNLFGSDLISERSLDEVILGYLAEEDGADDSGD